MDKESWSVALLKLSMLVTTSFIIVFYAIANEEYGVGGLPLGWDTASYLGEVRMIITQGFLPFAGSAHYQHILYPLVASIPVNLGISPNLAEMILPVVFSVALALTIGYLSLTASGNALIGALSATFAAGWFGLYRMGADFHSNLLAFFLLVLAATFLFRTRSEGTRGSYGVAFVSVTILASFAHAETTAYFLLIWFLTFVVWDAIACATKLWRRTLFLLAIAALAVSPEMALLVQNAVDLTIDPKGLAFRYPIAPIFWLQVIGPVAVLAVAGLTLAFMLAIRDWERGFYAAFVLVWGLTSVGIGSLAYIIPSFPIAFSDRVLLLFPLPLTCSITSYWLWRRFVSPNSRHLLRSATLLFIAIPLVTAPAVYAYATPAHFRTYIDASTYSDLVWLEAHAGDGKPIFVYSFPDECAGLLTNLYEGWVSATVGSHLAYMGRLESLLLGEITPFSNPLSAMVAQRLMGQLWTGGALANGELVDKNVILLSGFNTQQPPQAFPSLLVEEHPGIWLLNTGAIPVNGPRPL